VIEFKKVTFSYKGSADILKDFSLTVNKGERVHISAPSGKGKTTLLRIICSLEKVKKGSFSLENGAKLSVVFQEDRLIPYQTVKDNVALFSNEKTADVLLEKLGLEDAKNLFPEELSGGMKRRVALARALSKDFDILLLDEAFTGLDEKALENALKVTNEYLKDKTLVLISHSEKEAEFLKAKKVNI